MKIAVVGTGYVGLVTGVALSEIGHTVTCIDIDEKKVQKMSEGVSPIYEPGLSDLMIANIERGRLNFTTDYELAMTDTEVTILAVGTPESADGSANLTYIKEAARMVGENAQNDLIVVTKSTVPVGTNRIVEQIVKENVMPGIKVNIASNPEFLREGQAVNDTFNGDRIVIGTDNQATEAKLRELYAPLNVPVYATSIESSEMIKYAANAFLATKISFINEVANVCELVGADVDEVANGMGLDNRIGRAFLNAGIGYGGSCFPKDTIALVNISKNAGYEFEMLDSVMKVNKRQQKKLVDLFVQRFDNKVEGLKVAILGLAFKPETDDLREAASLVIIKELINLGVTITAYDPIAMEGVKKLFPYEVTYTNSAEEALMGADATFLVTDWAEFMELTEETIVSNMKTPLLFDGRNQLQFLATSDAVEYHSIGKLPNKAAEKELISK